MLWYAAFPRWSKFGHTRELRELRAGRLGRVVVDWADLGGNEDDYERRI